MLFEAYPTALARRVLARGLAAGEGPLTPAVLTRLDPADPALVARLERCAVEDLWVLIPALRSRGDEATLLHLARHRWAEVSLPAMQALAVCGSLASVAPLLALARAAWAPSRRGAALRVARTLQARFGVPAQGALSWAPQDDAAGRLSDA